MNETLQTIAQRYSCRNYTGQPPTQQQLEAIAAAAIQSPSAMNLQPWRVIVVQDKQLIADMEEEVLSSVKNMEDQSAYQRIQQRGGLVFYNAPTMIVLPIEQSQHSPFDCGIVAQTVALAAASLGLGSVICGMAGLAFAGPRGAEFAARLGFPEGFRFGGAVLVGEAAVQANPHTPDATKISWI